MELLVLGLTGLGMVAAVFAVGTLAQVLFDRRFGVPRRRPDRTGEQLEQQSARSALGPRL